MTIIDHLGSQGRFVRLFVSEQFIIVCCQIRLKAAPRDGAEIVRGRERMCNLMPTRRAHEDDDDNNKWLSRPVVSPSATTATSVVP